MQTHTESRQFFPKTLEKNDDDTVVIYNRVPKTGSTSFVGVAYDLCKKNNFKVLHINITANRHIMSLNNQYKFAQNVTKWDEVKPALYHGHMAFLNFDRWVANYFIKQYFSNYSIFGAADNVTGFLGSGLKQEKEWAGS